VIRALLLRAAFSAVIGFSGATLSLWLGPPEPELPDEAYIEVARSTAEAQLFEGRYGRGDPFVDRSGQLAVDLRTDDGARRLRIFIDARTNRPKGALLECANGFEDRDVLGYLRTSECASVP
jgi:hypothetical protein